MKTALVELWRFNGTCINGHRFITHDFPDFEYGRTVIRTSNPDDMAFIDGINDPVFDEVADIVKELVTAAGKKSWSAHCFDQVFGVACDPAPSGYRYDFTEKVRCPVCGSTELPLYGWVDPPQTDIVELPYVTYNAWQKLSYDQKRERMREAIEKTNCLSYLSK